MTDIKDTQLSPMETQLADDPIPLLPVFKSEAKDKDTGTPLVNSTASPAMTDAKDTQPSPVEAPPVDETTVPVAKPNARIHKDLPATQGASPARLEDPVAPTTILVDTLAGPPTLASHMVRRSGISVVDKGSFLSRGGHCGKCTLQIWKTLVAL